MPPQFPEFREFSLSDRELFEKASGPCPRAACEYSFANLVIWRDFDRPMVTSINENLCVLLRPPVGDPFFLEPLGSNDIFETVEACIMHAGRVSRVSPLLAESLGGNGYGVRPIPEHFDYLYRTSELAELKGRRFDGKRNHIRRLQERYPRMEYAALSRDDSAAALFLFDEWQKFREARGPVFGALPALAYSCQRASVARLFESFDELEILGGKLLVDGDMAGFIAGSASGPDVACVHFCYSRPGFPGAFPLMLKEACGKTFSHFEQVNLEQDLGLAGLRKNKMSFYPFRLEEKFEISRGRP